MLLVVVFIYALTFTFVAAIPAVQQAIAIGVVTLFVLCDLFLFGLQQHVRRGTARRSILCAYYCTAFTVATLGCWTGWASTGFPLPEFEVVNETALPLFDAIGRGLAPAVVWMAIMFCYTVVFVLFSLLGFTTSLFSLRRSWIAGCLLVLVANLPGTAIALLYLGALAYCSLAGCK